MFDPFGILGDGMAPLPVAPGRSPIQPLTKGEEESVLKRVTGGALSGLGYVGGVLDKSLGGRAIRGALGGKPRELLSVLPGSDTFGLTDEQDRVSGEDLAKQAGILQGEGEKGTFELRDLLGPAIEMGLDPATYLSFGGSALTKAGQVAKRVGVLKGVSGGTARAGTTLGAQLAGKSPEVLSAAKRAAEALGASLPELSGMKLGGHVGIGLPFSHPLATFDLSGPLGVAGKVAQTAWHQVPFHEQLGSFGQGIKNVGTALFDKGAGGTLNPAFQEASRAAQDAAQQTVAQQRLALTQAARDLQAAGHSAPESLTRVVAHNEGQLANLPAGLSHPLAPAEQQAADFLKSFFAPMAPAEQAVGSTIENLPNYHPGYLEDVGRQTEGFGRQKLLSATHGSQIGREEIFKNLRGHYGKQQLSLDPNVVGPNRLIKGPEGNMLQEAAYIRQKHLGMTPEMEQEMYDLAGGIKGIKEPARPLTHAEQAEFTDLAIRNGPKHGTLAGDPAAELRLEQLQRQAKEAERLAYLQELNRHSHKLADWAARLDPAAIGPEGAFISDPFRAAAKRGEMHARMLANAEAMTNVLAKSAGTLDQLGPGALNFLDVMEEAGLGNRQALAEQLRKRIPGITPEQILGLHVPADLARDVTRFSQGFALPDVLKPAFENFLDPLTATTKALQTGPWPGFHLRNLPGHLMQSLQTGLNPLELGSTMSKAQALLERGVIQGAAEHPFVRGLGLTDEQATRKLADLAYAHGATAQFHQAADVAGQGVRNAKEFLANVPGEEPWKGILPTIAGGIPHSLAEAKPWNVAGGFGGLENDVFAPVRAGRELGQHAENMHRIGNFLALGEKGYAPAEAANLVRQAHVDYGGLSGFEKTVMRRLVPFYTFARGNIPWQVQQLMEHPGGLTAQVIRAGDAARDKEGFVPEHLQSGLTVPIGKEEDGTQRFLTALGLPHEAAFELLKPGPKGAERTAMALLGQTNPLLKGPLEFATGKQFYSGRDLADLHSTTGVPTLEQIMMNSPLSRAYTSGRTLLDPRKGLLGDVLNLGTGLKVTDVDMEKQRSVAARELIDEELRGQPGIRRFSQLSVRPEDLGSLTPEEIALLRLNRTLELAAQQKARQAHAQGK